MCVFSQIKYIINVLTIKNLSLKNPFLSGISKNKTQIPPIKEVNFI